MSKVKEIAAKCFRDEAQAILDLIPQLDDHFDAAVDLILRCKGKVIITGVGEERPHRGQDGGHAVQHRDACLFHQSFGCLPWRLGGDDRRRRGGGHFQLGADRRIASFRALSAGPPHSFDWHIRQSGFAVGQVCHVSSERESQPGSLPAELGAHIVHNGRPGHGRRAGLRAHRDAAFPGKGLCAVPPRRNAGGSGC